LAASGKKTIDLQTVHPDGSAAPGTDHIRDKTQLLLSFPFPGLKLPGQALGAQDRPGFAAKFFEPGPRRSERLQTVFAVHGGVVLIALMGLSRGRLEMLTQALPAQYGYMGRLQAPCLASGQKRGRTAAAARAYLVLCQSILADCSAETIAISPKGADPLLR
jgi:hypothetical protein